MEHSFPQKARTIVFSPTGTTAKTARTIAEGTGLPYEETEISSAEVPKEYSGELLIFAFPVYGGRIPAFASDWLRTVNIEGSLVSAVVVYGNRAYDDALAELVSILRERGGIVIGAAAFIAEHSIARSIAAGRPDGSDLATALDFGRQLRAKGSIPMSAVIPGSIPTERAKRSSLFPSADERCTHCGTCVRVCPVKAISAEKPEETDTSRCICCMRCISVCPAQARALPAETLEKVTGMLSKIASKRREPELFL